MSKMKTVGSSFPRHESISKVTGSAEYTDDLNFPNAVYGAILRSPHANAVVRSMDVKDALKIPGILAVLTPDDVTHKLFNCSGNPPSDLLFKDERILTDRALYAGDRIAAVAGETEEACKKALNAITVDYEILKPVFRIEDALKEGAAPIHPHLYDSNIVKKLEVNTGDMERAFEESDHIFEEEFYTPQIQVTAMEPTGCICDYTNEKKLNIWSTSQTVFQERRILADLLDMKEKDIRMVKPAMGGGFGARQQLHNQHVCALLSKAVKRPVKIINTREEEMLATIARHEVKLKIRMGVMNSGRINACHIESYFNTGPYTSHGPTVVAAATKKMQYNVPNYRFEGYCVLTNSPVSGAVRGYGNPQINFGREILLDRIAKKLQMDPVELRLMNHVKTGEKFPGWTDPIESCAIEDCINGVMELKDDIDKADCSEKDENIDEAWGVAFGCHTSGPSNKTGMSSAIVMANGDGSVNLMVGSADIGQGSETTLSQVAAERLGVELSDVRIKAADTLNTPYDTGTFASSQMFVCGNAVRKAADSLIENTRRAISDRFSVPFDEISFNCFDGFSLEVDNIEKTITFKEAVKEVTFGATGMVLIGNSSYKAEAAPPPFSVCMAKVAVNRITDEIRVKHFIQGVDVGTAVNPSIVEGQIEGGIHMGLGYALMENIEINNMVKKPVSSDLLHYKALLSEDMPETYTYIAKGYEPKGPLGAKSVGELSTVAVASAVAIAVTNATGNEIVELPLSKKYTLTGSRSDQRKFLREVQQ
ncbi:xanthine dehydrogenase molybdenum-binding subunit [Dethiosulfatibacter aminovorans DSM 17477]|uniref:Xanthine dehydrogenase molybdenum-binding subunit n=1 Tax=Dethiosulfatibacter aminovorans DSM 17477 TaxID=1121476 RepID=A0A1M6AB15_9FIRM|nr:molybdopterin cofactor-binding domain-containing protein [Dethiosulfatibacter aminovorans]SHI33617.1 xanthine dehydrogenase molybdenum-binding subunit [Dethiosulfatibacter aminovorans DSM 17477]